MMRNKFKLLISLIVITGVGIAVVLGVWLYGSYNNRRDLFLSSAERALFNVIQDVYQLRTGRQTGEYNRDLERQHFYDEIKKAISARAPGVDTNKVIREVLVGRFPYDQDEGNGRRGPRFGEMKDRDRERQGPIVPPFLFRDFEMDLQNQEIIADKLKQALTNRGIYVPFQLKLIEIPREHTESRRDAFDNKNLMQTRPLMVNPSKSQFLIVKFDQVWKYLLFDLGWQLSISVLLVGLLLGTFVYLIWTIWRQDRLAEMRKAFVDNMTHELKTPVSTVMAAVEAIQIYGVKNDPVKMERYLQISRRELEHLSGMIEKVLQMDIDETKGIKLHKTRIDVLELVESVAEMFRMNNLKQVMIQVDSKEHDVHIDADEPHLRNVLNNLIENAVKYSGQTVEINILIQIVKENVQISIADTGNGIPSEYINQIFDLFFRVPEGNLHTVKGFGLGLAYVKQVVNQHGGKIVVVSELSKGSTFTIYLPKK